MKKVLLSTSLLGWLVFLWCLGCETGGYLEDSTDEDEDENLVDPALDPLFSTFPNLANSLLPQMDLAATLQKTGSIKYPFCIYTVDIARDVKVEDQVQQWATTAMNTWIAPLNGQPQWKVTHAEAYRVAPKGTTCPSSDNGIKVYSIRISGMSGANNTAAGLKMNMGTWGVNSLVVLHEMGHGIGLADTYSWDGRKPIGQPSATMNNQWNLGGKLQQDDIDGIRFVWARLRGATNPCPDGYTIGQIEINNKPTNTGTWGETFCLPSADSCPNDPNKKSPGICGCGVADTDSDKDGTADCKDGCKTDPKKTAPGSCGCGVTEGSCSSTSSVYQAEAYTNKTGCALSANHSGYTGTGFMDYGGNGTWLEWNNVNAAAAGSLKLTFRYAAATGRPCAILVNGANVGTVSFASTGAWTTWSTATITANLRAGNNTIRVVANTSTGGPNLDKMDLTSTSTALASKDLVGHYERSPILNNWHKVDITLENNALWWKNASAVRWSLTLAGDVLKTGPDCPYGVSVISVEKQTGSNTVTGLRFNGELYQKR